ncbi:MAG TPA: MFS transporter [Terracidiphilus sp.]|nr:MFS transporter [Terracidiphilus sp.]
MFYLVAFCMDFGFGLFIFLFNLYLTDIHFDERAIGRVLACITLGNVVGTIPGMMMTRRYGLQTLLLFTFSVVPVLSAMRVWMVWESAQYVLAFATGAALCGWPICFSPVIAQLTNEENRTAGFSLAFATGIGLGTLAGVAGGYIPEILAKSRLHLSLVSGIQIVLLFACVVVAMGLWPLRRLELKRPEESARIRVRVIHPYLLRFLPAFLLWNVATGSFPMFGAVYLQKTLGISLGRLGTVFAASQLMQFVAVLCSPLLLKRLGKAGGVAAAQIGTAVFLVCIASAHALPVALGCYVLYFAAQFMCGPGIYQILMEHVPEAERSSASALQNLCGALCQAGTAALTGICIMTYGYQALMFANSGVAVVAAVLFVWLGAEPRSERTALGRDAIAREATE